MSVTLVGGRSDAAAEIRYITLPPLALQAAASSTVNQPLPEQVF